MWIDHCMHMSSTNFCRLIHATECDVEKRLQDPTPLRSQLCGQRTGQACTCQAIVLFIKDNIHVNMSYNQYFPELNKSSFSFGVEAIMYMVKKNTLDHQKILHSMLQFSLPKREAM